MRRIFEIAKHRKFAAAASLAALAGCAASPPQVITQTRTVEVPVAVPCKVREVARPDWALDQVDPAADVFTKGRAGVGGGEAARGLRDPAGGGGGRVPVAPVLTGHL